MHSRTAVSVALMLLFTGLWPVSAAPALPDAPHSLERMTPLAPFSPPRLSRDCANSPWYLTTAMDRDKDRVSDALEAGLGADGACALVDFADGPSGQDLARLEDLGLNVLGSYELVHVVLVERLNVTLLEGALGLPDVVFIEGLLEISAGSDVANPAVKVRESPEYSPCTVWEMGYKGKGINICVLDTGVDNGHPTFSGRFVAGADFTKPRSRLFPRDGSFDPDDVYGHGTTCAGIALGSGASDGKYAGNAPEAGLIDGRVGTSAGFTAALL